MVHQGKIKLSLTHKKQSGLTTIQTGKSFQGMFQIEMKNILDKSTNSIKTTCFLGFYREATEFLEISNWLPLKN